MAKTAKRGTRKTKQTTRSKKAAAGRKGAAVANRPKMVNYPIAETLRWVADGEKLLVKWGAIRSPAARRIAGTVGRVLSVLEALADLRKV